MSAIRRPSSNRRCGSLVRRELLVVDDDPRSPERGQYGFVGALIREVAYGTLARRDRRSRHLAAARHFEALGDDELAGVLASHYVAAHEASQPGPEADAVAAQARLALRGAAERALAVASPDAAVTYLRRALDVTTDPAEVARLREDIARTALRAADWPLAESEARNAITAQQAVGDARGVARATSILGNILFHEGQIEASVEMLRSALEGLGGGDEALVIEMYRQLGRAEMFRAQPDQALTWVKSGLTAAAKLDDLESIGDLLITRAWAVGMLGRLRESIAENRGALQFARLHGLTGVELRAANNLATFQLDDDPAEAVALLRESMALAERVGDRNSLQKLAFAADPMTGGGDWAGAEALIARWLRDDAPNLDYLPLAIARATMLAWSGRHDDAALQVRRMRERAEKSESAQDAFAIAKAEVWVALAAGDDRAAHTAAEALEVAYVKLGGPGWPRSLAPGAPRGTNRRPAGTPRGGGTPDGHASAVRADRRLTAGARRRDACPRWSPPGSGDGVRGGAGAPAPHRHGPRSPARRSRYRADDARRGRAHSGGRRRDPSVRGENRGSRLRAAAGRKPRRGGRGPDARIVRAERSGHARSAEHPHDVVEDGQPETQAVE